MASIRQELREIEEALGDLVERANMPYPHFEQKAPWGDGHAILQRGIRAYHKLRRINKALKKRSR